MFVSKCRCRLSVHVFLPGGVWGMWLGTAVTPWDGRSWWSESVHPPALGCCCLLPSCWDFGSGAVWSIRDISEQESEFVLSPLPTVTSSSHWWRNSPFPVCQIEPCHVPILCFCHPSAPLLAAVSPSCSPCTWLSSVLRSWAAKLWVSKLGSSFSNLVGISGAASVPASVLQDGRISLDLTPLWCISRTERVAGPWGLLLPHVCLSLAGGGGWWDATSMT